MNKLIKFQGDMPCRKGDRIEITKVVNSGCKFEELEFVDALTIHNLDTNCTSVSRMALNRNPLNCSIKGIIISSKIENGSIDLIADVEKPLTPQETIKEELKKKDDEIKRLQKEVEDRDGVPDTATKEEYKEFVKGVTNHIEKPVKKGTKKTQ